MPSGSNGRQLCRLIGVLYAHLSLVAVRLASQSEERVQVQSAARLFSFDKELTGVRPTVFLC